jgi:hypothetical protein
VKRLLVLAAIALAGCDRNEHEPACLDTRAPVAASDPLPIGFTGQDVMGFVAGSHRATLTWPTGEAMGLQHVLESPRLFFVESRPNPEYRLEGGRSCSNHLLLEGPVQISTDDGHLDETLPLATIRSTDGRQATGILSVDAGKLKGPFGPEVPQGRCFRRLQFNTRFAPGAFSGTVMKEIASAPCGQKADGIGVGPSLTGTWR